MHKYLLYKNFFFDYFANSDEKLFTDLRRGKGYTGELEKINRDDYDLTITVTLEATTTKKNEIMCNWTLPG